MEIYSLTESLFKVVVRTVIQLSYTLIELIVSHTCTTEHFVWAWVMGLGELTKCRLHFRAKRLTVLFSLIFTNVLLYLCFRNPLF